MSEIGQISQNNSTKGDTHFQQRSFLAMAEERQNAFCQWQKSCTGQHYG